MTRRFAAVPLNFKDQRLYGGAVIFSSSGLPQECAPIYFLTPLVLGCARHRFLLCPRSSTALFSTMVSMFLSALTHASLFVRGLQRISCCPRVSPPKERTSRGVMVMDLNRLRWMLILCIFMMHEMTCFQKSQPNPNYRVSSKFFS